MQIVRHVVVYHIGKIFRRNQCVLNDNGFRGAEDHGKNIHQQDAGEVEQIEPQIPHGQIDHSAQLIGKEKIDQNQNGIGTGGIGKDERDKTPYLPFQNGAFVKAKQGVNHITAVYQTQQIYNGGTDHHIEHQIRNALVTVLIAETVKPSTQIFQYAQLLYMVRS